MRIATCAGKGRAAGREGEAHRHVFQARLTVLHLLSYLILLLLLSLIIRRLGCHLSVVVYLLVQPLLLIVSLRGEVGGGGQGGLSPAEQEAAGRSK